MDLSGDVAPDDPPVGQMTPFQTPSRTAYPYYRWTSFRQSRHEAGRIPGICTYIGEPHPMETMQNYSKVRATQCHLP